MDRRQVRSDFIALAAFVALVVACLPVSAPNAQGTTTTAFNRCIAVTPSDTVDLTPFTQSQLLTGMIYTGGAGNITAVTQDGATVLFTAPPIGAIIPIAARRINSTGTTSTPLIACYRV